MVVAALIIAIVGAVTGVASLCWNIASWQRSGPIVRVQATCSGRGDDMKVYGTVSNTGRFDASLSQLGFGWYLRGTWISVPIPAERVDGLEIPSALPAQNQAEFVITGVASLDPGLSAALHDRRRVEIGFTTGSGKPAQTEIKYA